MFYLLTHFFTHAQTAYPEPSGMPTITHTQATTHSVLLRWSALPPDQQNGIITGYVINVLEDGQQSSVPVTSDVTEYTLEAAPYRDYVLSVAAVNSVGRGPFSNIAEIQTPEGSKYLFFSIINTVVTILIALMLYSLYFMIHMTRNSTYTPPNKSTR